MGMRIHQEVMETRTPGEGLHNVTQAVNAVVAGSGIRTGLCTVFIQHTSASLVIQENADPSVLRDLRRWMADTVPVDRSWEHDDEGPDDMPAHVRCSLTSTSETIPVRNGKLALGTWQALYVWEHRERPHGRKLVIHVAGTDDDARG
jgi:secondary thiamine-phosphate synthase enzyme